ncbi:MAG: FAD-binding protein, partial [Actinobacteria bacterium]
MEGRPSDPLRRPGAAGPARRLDLPRPARRAALAHVTYDTIVIGAGVAGLTAALRLADEGKRVLVMA